MTKVDICFKDGHITALVADGHTDYGVKGEDIVCAALSSIIQTAALGLMQVAGIELELTRRDGQGYLAFKVRELSERQRYDADIILNTMLLGIDDLYQGFSDYIDLNITGR